MKNELKEALGAQRQGLFGILELFEIGISVFGKGSKEIDKLVENSKK